MPVKSQPDLMAFNNHRVRVGHGVLETEQGQVKYLLLARHYFIIHFFIQKLSLMHVTAYFSYFDLGSICCCCPDHSMWPPNDDRHLFKSPVSETVNCLSVSLLLIFHEMYCWFFLAAYVFTQKCISKPPLNVGVVLRPIFVNKM